LFIVVAVLAANGPFLSERVLFVLRPKSGNKDFAWRLVELLLLYFAVGTVGVLLEAKLGTTHTQSWEFYAITVALFVVFAYPGFVFRYLWRRPGR
jgi:uncharacterized membrane protein YsdA (DUF1294 family)